MRAKLRATEASSAAVQTANSLVSSELNSFNIAYNSDNIEDFAMDAYQSW